MKFSTAKEMLEHIQAGNDLYNPKLEVYVFLYNDVGSIAYYNINKDSAKSLSQKAKEQDEYWGAFLGPGGEIIDDVSSEFYRKGNKTNLQWCKNYYKDDNWINTIDYPQE